jgi:D-sedoheptulose 7-phosphate isomerase
MAFAQAFLADVSRVAERIDTAVIEQMAARLAAIRERSGRVFFVGVGGGAGHAGHAVCDFRKLADIEAYSVTDNVSELTARINDDGWDDSFAAWLRGSHFCANDALFVFSVGGGSEEPRVSGNIVNAVKLAKSVGAQVLGVVGRSGGYTAVAGDCVVVIPEVSPSLVTPLTESFQAVVWHLLVSHPSVARARAKWESLTPLGGSVSERA